MNAILRFVALIRILVLCLIQLIVRLTLGMRTDWLLSILHPPPFPLPPHPPPSLPPHPPPIPTPAPSPPPHPRFTRAVYTGKYRQCSFRTEAIYLHSIRKNLIQDDKKKKRHFLWSQVNDLPQPSTYPQLNINSFNLPGSFLLSKSKLKGFHWPGNFIIYYSNHVFSYHAHHSSSE